MDGTSLSGGGTFDKSSVYHRAGEDGTDYPRVVYEVFGQPVSFNDGSTSAPVAYQTNGSGEVTGEIHADYKKLRFDVRLIGTELEVEDLFEALQDRLTSFNKFRDTDTINGDITDFDVMSGSPEDETGTESTTHIDVLPLEVTYERYVTESGVPIRSIDSWTDIDDNDSPDDEVYTTS